MRFIYAFSAIFLFTGVVYGHDEDVHTVQYNADTFSSEVLKKNHFVMFYAPWCGHCQRLAPTWEQLAEMLNEETSNIRIAKVDCTTDTTICLEQDVTGYPTLKFFKVGETEGVKFKGMRDLPSLTAFINEQLSSDSDETVKVPGPTKRLIELSEDDFEKHVASGKHFVKFYAPWCGHCQKLAPTWEELAQNMPEDFDASIAKIDCTQYRSICNQFDIKGYPTLLWIVDGKKIEKYQGSRALSDLKTYAIKMSGESGAGEDKGDEASSESLSAVVNLTGEDFDEKIKETTLAIVKFFAPWCGHCKRLAPTWEELGKKYAEDDNVIVVKIDCTQDVNKQLCRDQEIEGFPTIFLYKSGKKISEYNGNRSLEDLHEFVTTHLASHDEL